MSGKVKKCGYKNGQGYCGWYTNKDGRKMFLRSTKEFIYANYLDFMGFHFLTEKSIFEINGKMYKPDFFIYDKDYSNLIRIVEVKDTKAKALSYVKSFESFFTGLDIGYSVVWEFRKLIKNLALEEKIKKWIENFEKTYNKISVSGENNPMWGMRHSEKTKTLIGQRTKEYMKDPVVKSKHSASIKSFWDSDLALETKEKYRKLRHEEKTKRDVELNRKNPIINNKICVWCGNAFTDRVLGDRETCSNSCSQKRNWNDGKMVYCGDGKKSYKTKILNYAEIVLGSCKNTNKEDFYSMVKELKDLGKIPKHFSLSKSVVEKYFGSVENLQKEIKNG